MRYVIRETDEYYPLSVLCHESGMEVEISHVPAEQMVKMWRMDDAGTGRMLACAALQIRDGVYVLGDLAVREDRRGEGLGKRMQQVVFDEARRRGAKEIWGSAKVPAYYYKLGWEQMDWGTSPDVAVCCRRCPRRGDTCSPAVIKMTL